MLKLFRNIGVRITLYNVLTALGIWFYLDWQEPTLINQILFGVFGSCMFICCSIDVKVALKRFLNTPTD